MAPPKDPLKLEEWRRKQREAKTGKRHSEESKEKIRLANLGHKVSEETIAKMKSSHIGKPMSEEAKEKQRNNKIGCSVSEETRIKQSCTRRGISVSEFNGFSTKRYCELWTDEFRERVRAFFGYVCMYPGCGKTQEEEGRKLSVHHVNYDKQTCCRENEDVSSRKFVTLCNRHNLAVNYDRELWERYFVGLINDEYEGRCYFTKEEWAWLNAVMWQRYEQQF